jgi:hypothetical protein
VEEPEVGATVGVGLVLDNVDGTMVTAEVFGGCINVLDAAMGVDVLIVLLEASVRSK